jgi:uncharacterized membrane protein YeiH
VYFNSQGFFILNKYYICVQIFLVMSVITVLDYIGVLVFAMSGILTASDKKLDLFGGFIIAFVTALGGGTLRDLFLNVDVGWIQHTNYIYVVIFATIGTLIFKKTLKKIRKTIFLFDTIGISLFTILGVQKALELDTHLIIAVMFGVITATFGGVIRDILCNEIPLIFRKEIYATACVLGGICYVSLYSFDVSENINLIISGLVIIGIRTLAVLKKYSLPVLNDKI